MIEDFMPSTIMIFAAGYGKRMAPLTDTTPKPLIEIAGRSMLYRMLDLVLSYPFKQIIINSHHLADQVKIAAESYFNSDNKLLKKFKAQYGYLPKLIVTYEEKILETAGSLKSNLASFKDEEVIYTCNSDVILICKENPFELMLKNWQSDNMNMLMLLHETAKAVGYTGKGDFFRDDAGYLTCAKYETMPYMYTGIALIKTSMIAQQSEEVMSLNQYFPGQKYEQKTCSVVNPGHWCHATSPDDVKNIEQYVVEQLRNISDTDSIF